MIDTTVDITMAFLRGPEHTSEARLLNLLARERAQSQLNLSIPPALGGQPDSDSESVRSANSARSKLASKLPHRTQQRVDILSPTSALSHQELSSGVQAPKPNATRAASYLAPMQGTNTGSPYLNSEYAATGPIHAQLAEMRAGAPSTPNLTGGRLGTLGSINEVLPGQLDDPDALGSPGTINWHPILTRSELATEEAILGVHGHDNLDVDVGPPIDDERELMKALPHSKRQSMEKRAKLEELLSDHGEE